MKRMTIVIGTDELVVSLDEASAPGLSRALLRSLPHATLAVHCQVAGAEFCVPVPFFHWHENRRSPDVGDVGYASFGNYLCFYYGAMAPQDGPTNIVGRVLSSRSTLESVGAQLLTEGAQAAYLCRDSDRNASPPALPLRNASSRLTALSRALLEATLSSPPPDIVNLRRARLPAMGNIAGRLQAGVLLLGLAEAVMHARSIALSTPSTRSVMALGLAAQMERYSRWVAMAGLPDTAAWLASVCDALRAEPRCADELADGLDEALVAIGRLRFWAEAVSPWHRVTDEYFGSEANWMHLASGT